MFPILYVSELYNGVMAQKFNWSIYIGLYISIILLTRVAYSRKKEDGTLLRSGNPFIKSVRQNLCYRVLAFSAFSCKTIA